MMLAAHHNQENVYTHQAGASKQQLQAKTPGARYPKTPLKIPLNDENTNHGFNGKSMLRGKGNNENTLTVGKGANGLGKSGKMAMVTPAAEPRTARAPLGNKTTNAKANRATHQTPGVKGITRELEKTTIKPTATLRPKHAAPQTENSKLEVHTDKNPLEDEEVEYAPPRPKDLPYESDVFPDGVLTFDGLKPENLFKGYYQYYFNRVGDDGKTAMERDMDQRQQQSFERGEEQIRRDMDEFDWSIGDIPESKDLFKKKANPAPAASAVKKVVRAVPPKQPSTLTSREAASALSMTTKPAGIAQLNVAKRTAPTGTKAPTKGFLLPTRKAMQRVAQPPLTVRERATAVAASRSTLGYNKGRSISSAVHATSREPATIRPALQDQTAPGPKPRTLMRSVSTASTGSDATITPARFAQSAKQQRPDFLSIFDGDDEEDALGGGGMPPMDDDEEDFQLTVRFE